MPITISSRLKFLSDSLPASKESREDVTVFFLGLKNQEYDAIRQLAKQVSNYLFAQREKLGLPQEDLEEIANDAVFITLKKISDNQFVLKEAGPATYAIAIAKNLVGNRLQKKQVETTSLDDSFHQLSAEFNPESYLIQKEKMDLLDAQLDRLDEPCRRLILLRYFERISDEEAIEQKMTTFSNAKSLKVQRCKCLKKLSEMMHGQKRFFTE